MLPGWEFLVAIYPQLRSYFLVSDQLDFTAYPVVTISSDDGTATCTTPSGAVGMTDPGSVLVTDAFRNCTFTVGTYIASVGSYVQWASATRLFGVPNTFSTDGVQGVVAGQTYNLVLSLQRQPTNPDFVSLEGKTITVIDGARQGQSATITGYDAETRKYTVDARSATSGRRRASSRSRSRWTTSTYPASVPDRRRRQLRRRAHRPPDLRGRRRAVRGRRRRDAGRDPDVRLAPGLQPGRELRPGEPGAGARRDHAGALHAHGHAGSGPAWIALLDGTPFAVAVHDAARAWRTIAQALVDAIDADSRFSATARRTTGASSSRPTTTCFYADFSDHAGDRRHRRRRRRERRRRPCKPRRHADPGRDLDADAGTATTYHVHGRVPATTSRRSRASSATGSAATWLHTYDVVVVGRVLTVTRYDGVGRSTATLSITPVGDARGDATAARDQRAARVHAGELEHGADRLRVGGRRRGRRRRRRARLPGLRGSRQPRSAARSIVDGGPRTNDEQFLDNPLLLPGETNLPIPTGTIGGAAHGQRRRARSPTSNATHVNAQYGERARASTRA